MSSCREEILYRQIIRVSKNCARKFGDKYVKSLPISSMFTTINRMKYLTKFHSVYKGDTLCSMAECGNCRKNLTLNLFAASTLRPAKFRTQQLASRVEFTMSHCHDTLAPQDGDGKRRRQIDVAVTPRAGDYGDEICRRKSNGVQPQGARSAARADAIHVWSNRKFHYFYVLLLPPVINTSLLITSALIVPPTRLSTVGDRAFPTAASRIWNSLPRHLAPSLQTFRRRG